MRGLPYASRRRNTFHTTNCSPQVKGFNQSQHAVENWGDLENFVTAQGRGDRLSLFAGSVLADSDPVFPARMTTAWCGSRCRSNTGS
jgi:DNA/RNA endonuclease G (NUC1)